MNKQAISADRLSDIAIAHGTDKQGVHNYADAYERHLHQFRHQPITLIEIGIGGYADPHSGGESLRMWKQYFPFAQIVGVDLFDKSSLAEERITILQGDQSDPAFLANVAAQFGPFAIVVDDGSHASADVIASFRALFPHVIDGGVYAIEDLQTSYWETYGGSSRRNRRGTTMTFLHELADGLNYVEFDIAGYEPSYTDRWVTSMTLYHNLAFIQKGRNLEQSNVLPPHPRPRAVAKRSMLLRAREVARPLVPRPVWRAIRNLVRRVTGSRDG